MFHRATGCKKLNHSWKKTSTIYQNMIRAASWQNQKNGMCAQRRLRSALASAQSDQSSLSAWRNIGSLATHWVHSKDSDQADLSLRWAHSHFVGFVMRWPILNHLYETRWCTINISISSLCQENWPRISATSWETLSSGLCNQPAQLKKLAKV